MVYLQKLLKLDIRSITRDLGFLLAKKKQCQVCDEPQSEEDQKALQCYKECASEIMNIEDMMNVPRRQAEDAPKVIIVGGGIAGLSAATHLIKNGIKNVEILEASDRVGGRVLTSWMGDTVIELGPNIIHGASVVNPIYNLANMGGSLNQQVIRRNDKNQINYLTSDSRIIDDYAVPNLLFNKFMDQARSVQKKELDCSLLDFLSLRIQQLLIKLPEKTRYDTEKVLYGMVNNLKSNIGAEMNSLSTQHFVVNQKLPGGDVRIPQGFCAVLSQLLQDIPPECIKYNKTVSTINWSVHSEPQVVVHCSDGDVFFGNIVIIAIPLGVLKHNIYSMFKPSLSESKVNAINRLGVGNVNRVYLEYLSPWWPSESLNLRIAWSPMELKEWKTWTKGIGAIEEVGNSNRVISFSIGGEDAIEMDSYSEVEIAIEFTNFLRKFMGIKTIPFPNNIAIKKWSCNSNFLGSTTYMPVGCNVGLIKNLFMPDIESCGTALTQPILFAGEATHDKYFGTIHGARLSGIREAERVIKSVDLYEQRYIRESEKLALLENIEVAAGN